MKDKKKGEKDKVMNVILFPGEEFAFNENLLSFEAFGYHNKSLTSKRCCLLLCDKSTNQPLDDADEEIYRSLGNYYSPRVDDFVIGTIVHKAGEYYKLDIGTYTYGVLPSIEFEGATKKTKPNLVVGDAVFCRVMKVNKFDSPTLTCISQYSTKNWASGESFFGHLKDGNIFSFDKSYAGELYKPDNFTLNRLSDVCSYEIAAAHNGKLWINSTSPQNIVRVYQIIMSSFRSNKETIESLIHKYFLNQNMNTD
jgi:exosome complex component RRP40